MWDIEWHKDGNYCKQHNVNRSVVVTIITIEWKALKYHYYYDVLQIKCEILLINMHFLSQVQRRLPQLMFRVSLYR